MFFSNRTPDRESSVVYHCTPVMEKHGASTESSNDSFSSWSPPSPFSYLESSTSAQTNYQSVDFRDVVKDSMYRESRGLSHKTIFKKESSKWYCDERHKLSRSKSCQFKDGLSFSIVKDYPRFSFDGRETQTDPRLSADSKERSIRTLNFVSLVPIKPSDSKSNLPSKSPKIDTEKDLGHTRPPSVVAKLMGLETYPNSTSFVNVSDKCGSVTKTREPTSPCWKNSEMKPISRVSIEAAPWKQRDGARVNTPTTKVQSSVSSVYGEMDKKLKNLEFGRSGKDLRALKQILEAMQKWDREDTTETSSDNDCQNREYDDLKTCESRIVVVKPAKVVGKGIRNSKAAKDANSERRSCLCTSSVDSRKQSNKQQSSDRISDRGKTGKMVKMDTKINASECFEETRSHSSNLTSEKSTLHVKVGEQHNTEYPSPISVLDDSVYMENSHSPVKRTPNPRTDDTTETSTEGSVKNQYKATNDVSRFGSKQKKIQDLVLKLKKFNSNHDETHTDYIASLNENTNPNPNDRYISEILLASGLLLKDLESFEFHSSGHPMNPNLFIVLEHTKFCKMQDGKFHRKLIFDAVNELLVEKLCSPSKTMQNPRTLLRELCIEIEESQTQKERKSCNLEDEGDDLKHILCDDVLTKSKTWTGFYGETSMIAVEVERMIFRDLVNEIVMSGACNL
ncbi:protein LONGIFOLIA 1-like [Rutidosis leptorrhynchoides]|uniref:protein LONGIFOLIA 1-like n=1 Tax=Rutidosis leptorrhynchoides TaxID=125765 RepID=UPI003A9A2D84